MVLNLGSSTVNSVVTGLEAGEWKLAIDVDNIAAGLTATPVTLNATQSFSLPAGGYKVYYKGEPAGNLVRGDVNQDGEVTIGDITVLIDIILSGSLGNVPMSCADVNADGEITIGDIAAVIDMILGK